VNGLVWMSGFKNLDVKKYFFHPKYEQTKSLNPSRIQKIKRRKLLETSQYNHKVSTQIAHAKSSLPDFTFTLHSVLYDVTIPTLLIVSLLKTN
jgi:hypothetical protein